ncbi:adenosylcobinamide-GDP ribazoletransferase [Alicyclobacillus acidoterrestris]|uniref:Adenosylcobinamide-GDP ribazoletransferase n=1 Tax=Alicyclobacillus acidoterrestris (strain ATCC 49025 / DSM 3922 / CIP 106132 / NCIMB 13137 / GD3B) TaxID=1356854 RepID=T0BS08_ALIAG|nr:adenosylcobinamide-GDP ribazoletransferase [Alicyclobacillus acidoterrestris]EPZ43300.1 hypothetical protein N007_13460 [Alicyclobacillus acidoterrestris ATCC 49025]UNO47717.1 adenosylcobinamide-GDP ribazoletransferase [Alicyclobacillus acidoterrestris]
MWRCFVLAWQFFTILPAPVVDGPTDNELRKSAYYLPVIGLGLGAIFGLCRWGLGLVMPLPAATFVALTVYTLTTGALHVDGLMDTADAIGSRKPREEALAIMKDSRVGAMGAIAAVLLLGGKWLAVSELPESSVGIIVLTSVLSRLAMLFAMYLAPAARPGGLGAIFAKRVHLLPVVLWSAVVVLCSAIFLPIVQVVAMTVACGLVTMVATRAFSRRFGGMTGDTYGALAELTEWVLYFVALAVIR